MLLNKSVPVACLAVRLHLCLHFDVSSVEKSVVTKEGSSSSILVSTRWKIASAVGLLKGANKGVRHSDVDASLVGTELSVWSADFTSGKYTSRRWGDESQTSYEYVSVLFTSQQRWQASQGAYHTHRARGVSLTPRLGYVVCECPSGVGVTCPEACFVRWHWQASGKPWAHALHVALALGAAARALSVGPCSESYELPCTWAGASSTGCRRRLTRIGTSSARSDERLLLARPAMEGLSPGVSKVCTWICAATAWRRCRRASSMPSRSSKSSFCTNSSDVAAGGRL